MRRVLLVASLLFAALCGLSGDAQAQVTRADSAAVLLEAAEGFAVQGDADIAQAVYRLILERFPETAAGRAAQAYLTDVRSEGTRGSGSVELQVWSTLYGLWLGAAIPGALGASGSEPYGVGLILGGPAGFFGGRALARHGDLTEGQARAITMGGSWGIWQGFGWREVFDWGVGETCEVAPWDSSQEYCYSNEGDTEENFAATIIGGLAGMGVGYALSSRAISPGVATTVNFGALWGTWFGVASGVLMDLDDDDLLAAALVGGDAGLVSMALLAPDWNVSRNRARIVSIAGVIGGLTGAGIDLLADVDDEKTAIGIPMVTSLIGLGVGMYSTREYDARQRGDAGGDGAFSGSLVDVTDGRWTMNTPVPYPVMLERQGVRGPVPTTGLGVTLFSAKFR
jgi:hypothetical protein